MIEVNMTVNELTEDANMEVGSAINVNGAIKNPFFNITLVNNNDPTEFPIPIRTLEGYDVSDGKLIESPIIANPLDYADGKQISIYSTDEDVFYYVVPQTFVVSDDEIDLVNCTYNADSGWLIVTDATKNASAVIISYS